MSEVVILIQITLCRNKQQIRKTLLKMCSQINWDKMLLLANIQRLIYMLLKMYTNHKSLGLVLMVELQFRCPRPSRGLDLTYIMCTQLTAPGSSTVFSLAEKKNK